MNNDRQQDQDIVSLSEEAHYHHVLMDVVELIYNYGWEPVLKDIIALKEQKEW